MLARKGFAATACVVAIFLAPSAESAVEDEVVKKWVARGFAGGDCKVPAIEAANVSRRLNDPGQVKNAWAFLKKCRDDRLTNSQEAVAAENYLYIRFVAGQTGDTGFKVFSWSYYALKVAGSKAGFLQMMRTNPNNPVSDPDPDVRRWGNVGYEDGIKDYEVRTGQKASLKMSSAEVAWKFLSDSFY